MVRGGVGQLREGLLEGLLGSGGVRGCLGGEGYEGLSAVQRAGAWSAVHGGEGRGGEERGGGRRRAGQGRG